MAKGDDAIRRKKNKLNRKKMRAANDTATVSTRIAAIIASKKRRLQGKRRNCQGMCFSLPTLEDPFNEGKKKSDFKTKENKKVISSKVDKKLKKVPKQKLTSTTPVDNVEPEFISQPKEAISESPLCEITLTNKQPSPAYDITLTNQQRSPEYLGCPSKFLVMCLNSIENELRHDGLFCNEGGKPLFVDTWGVEFWKCYLEGKDNVEVLGSCSTVEQIAWIAATAADDISRKEKEGLSLPCPFLLYLVPSQEKAIKVRSVCKPLKGIGIHTVSLHAGASVGHQILGLKSCEPEFLVSTPERLLELISLEAIDISEVSLLVVDGLEKLKKSGWFDATKSIMQLVSGSRHTVVFSDSVDNKSHLVEKLFHGKSSVHRLPSAISFAN